MNERTNIFLVNRYLVSFTSVNVKMVVHEVRDADNLHVNGIENGMSLTFFSNALISVNEFFKIYIPDFSCVAKGD